MPPPELDIQIRIFNIYWWEGKKRALDLILHVVEETASNDACFLLTF